MAGLTRDTRDRMKNNGLGSRKAALQTRTVTIISGTISPRTNERTWIIASPLQRPENSCEYEFISLRRLAICLACEVSLPRERGAFPTCVIKSRLFDLRNDNVTSDKSPLRPQSTYGDRLNGGKKSSNACGFPGGAAGDCSR